MMNHIQRNYAGSTICVGLAFAALAIIFRFSAGYPFCPNDESSWIYIAGQLDLGTSWPVSGPAFIEAAREISILLGSKHIISISLLGIIGVFIEICALQWGYKKFQLMQAGSVLIALSLSSYFWAPLLEARPQQWGQILVFLGVICAWLWIHRLGGKAFFLVMPLVAITHILSHAILAFLCGIMVLADFIEKRPLTKRHLTLLLVVVLSMGVYLLPHGPYAVMLIDLEQVQMKHISSSLPYLMMLPLVVGAILIGVQRKWHWHPTWTEIVARNLVRQRTAIGLSILCIVFTALAMQAYLLPSAAWSPYGGSWIRFLFFQLGNLIFAAFFVIGAHGLIEGLRTKELDPTMGRLLIWLLIGLGMLGLLSITISWWLLHTNWFLRVLNYGIFFAAMVTAIGIKTSMKNWPVKARFALLSLGIMTSVIATLRPPSLLGC